MALVTTRAHDMTMVRWLKNLFSAPPTTLAPPAPAFAPKPAPTPTPASSPAPTATPAPTQPAAAAAPRPAGPAVPFDELERVNTAWHDWLFERTGDDDAGLDLNDAETRVLDSLKTILASQQSGAALVRRMPGLIPQLLQSLRSDTFSGSALSRTISSDVVLVAAVIRLANTAYAGTGAAVSSVEQAVILIGQEGLRQLITTVAFRPIIDVHSGYFVRRLAPRLWEHAERSAASARQLAGDLGIEPFDAFLACMLQNVGLIVALRLMDSATNGAPGLGGGLFLAQLARDTRLLGASIAREWNFPETVVAALVEQGGSRRGAAMSPLGRLLQLTDHLGKLRMLAEQGLLPDADADLFAALPANAAHCYALLAASRETTTPI
jgi:HD-like signal output (HDOD) protein